MQHEGAQFLVVPRDHSICPVVTRAHIRLMCISFLFGIHLSKQAAGFPRHGAVQDRFRYAAGARMCLLYRSPESYIMFRKEV